MATVDYHFNRFTFYFVETDILGEGLSSDEISGVLEFRYFRPLYLKSTVWFDTDGVPDSSLKKEFKLTRQRIFQLLPIGIRNMTSEQEYRSGSKHR